jgi:hypothetical protein
MLNSRRLIEQLSIYLSEILIPRVNVILDKLGSDRAGTFAFGWEIHVRTYPYSGPEMVIASLTPSVYWVPILAVGALIISYAVLISAQSYTPSSSEVALIVINLLLLIFAAVRNAMTARAYLRRSHQLRVTKNASTATQSKSAKSRKTQ